MIRLERTFGTHTKVLGLLWRKLSELCSHMVQMQGGHFFVQVFWQTIDIDFLVLVTIRKKLNLSHDLVCEGI